nr:NADPH-dependent F420 reductase [uncultured Cupriavidus sp.]
MKIAVIGTGKIGAAYANALAKAQIEVIIGDRHQEKATALAQEIGDQAQGTTIEKALGTASVAIMALPYQAIVDVVAETKGLNDKVLIDVSNPVNDDFQNLVVGLTTSAAEQIQATAPKARVVKAFNTIFAQLVSPDAREGRSLQVFIAGDDPDAKSVVHELAKRLGFIGVDAGGLRNSRFLEPVGMMNIQFGFFLDAGPTTAPSWAHA